ncbi:MAG: pantoate--beta-alanine ligase [Rikenellaceae bacterium]
MRIIDNVTELQQAINTSGGGRVGFIPTMGAIHDGHLSLMSRARAECDLVVVSIFVNPTQFNDPNDLKNYPRQEAQDCALVESVGVDIVFVPSVGEIYPEPDNRQFDFGGVDARMEGASRPGHFNGVAQVVSRLFDIVQPTVSYFGQKDFQQVAVIRAMVRDLSLPVEIVEVPTVRECDGLALSSRNVLLTPEHRAAAPAIYAALSSAQSSVGAKSPNDVASQVVSDVEQSGLLRVIYFEISDARTLEPITDWASSDNIQGCIAVQAGAVRLIDNIKLK